MKRFLSSLPAALCLLAMPATNASAQDTAAPNPSAPVPPVSPPAAPPEKPASAAPVEKPAAKKSKKEKEREKKAKREKGEKSGKESSGFDPKSFLLKLVFNADDDGDGVLSTEEFRKVPLLKELKKERVDSLFAEIDADSNATLDAEEVGKGFGKITSFAKENRALLDDEDAAKQAKKLKRLSQ